MPAIVSPIETPVRPGARPGSPTSSRNPPYASGVKEPPLARELEYNNLYRALAALYGFFLIGVILFC